MTTLLRVTRRCAICEHRSEHRLVASVSRAGAPDLDFRPPERERSLVYRAVQECPACGYCAADIGQAGESAAEVVGSRAYQQLRRDAGTPPPASCLLRASLIEVWAGRFVAGGYRALEAAWVCDDLGAPRYPDAARRCRDRAIELFAAVRSRGQRFARTPGAERLLMVDLLRRAGRLEEARRLAEEGSGPGVGSRERAVLRFQLALLAEGDLDAYTMDVAVRAGPARAVPAYLGEVWPSRRDPADAWPHDTAAFLAVARRCRSLAGLWLRLPRLDWLLWLYGRSEVLRHAEGLGGFCGWCLRQALRAVPPEAPGAAALGAMVAGAEGRIAGRVTSVEWAEAVIRYVRRRPTLERSEAESRVFEAARRVGDRRFVDLVEAAEAALVVVPLRRRRGGPLPVAASRLRAFVPNPFRAPEGSRRRSRRPPAGPRP